MILRVMMPILPLVRVPNVYKLTKMAKITSAAIVEISGWGYFYYSYKNDAGLKRYFLNIMLPRMSSHCYKLFDLFSLDFSHKTVVLEQRTLYCCHKISREDVTSLLQVQ